MKQITKSFHTMSTQVDIKIFSDQPTVDINNALSTAENEFYRIAQTYTRFSESSELSDLNRHSGEFYEISEEFLKLIKTMLEFSQFSQGKYDPTVIDLLELHGYKSSFNPKKIVEEKVKIKNMKGYVSKRPKIEEIEIDEKQNKVKLAKDQRLDLGGVGKGYAMDCAVEYLLDVSQNFLLSAGGDVYAKGLNLEKEKEWQTELRVKLPSREGLQSIGNYKLKPSGESLASSGSWARSVGKFHHLINPTTGKPEDNYIQAFVSSEDCMKADGLATILFLCGENFIDKIRHKYSAESLLINSDEKIFASEGFEIC